MLLTNAHVGCASRIVIQFGEHPAIKALAEVLEDLYVEQGRI